MNNLQNIFYKLYVDEQLQMLILQIIKERYKERDISLDEKQIEEINKILSKAKFVENNSGNIEFRIDDDQIRGLNAFCGDPQLITINDFEKGKIDKEIRQKYQKIFPNMIDSVASVLLNALKKDAPSELKTQRKAINKFEKKLNKDWEIPFNLFEMFLLLAFEAGAEFNNMHSVESARSDDKVFLVLTHLHARACQIASEVFVLLKKGYADGAHARWRSLHEIAVIGSFINKHGNETAERYLLHDVIESHRIIKQYIEYSEPLKLTPLKKDEIDSVNKKYLDLIDRYGNDFKNNYGWAALALKKKNPNFCDIEKDTGLDIYRPYYKLASHNVHANPKSINFKLGLISNNQNVLLAGPSNTGFTDPAQDAVMSLNQITTTLLNTRPSVDNLVLCNVLSRLVSEIGEEFFKIQKMIEDTNSD